MVAMFWDSEGLILTRCVPKCTTVTSENYEDVLRTNFLPTLYEKRPQNTAALFVHHDNAPSHRAARVHQYFDDNNFEVVPHAPYTPDIAPSDFWLFPTLTYILRGRTFSSLSALATAIFQWSQRIPKRSVFFRHAIEASVL